MKPTSLLSFLLVVLLASSGTASAQLLGTLEANDNFGEALAAGYFDGDGYADLAVGVPAENLGSATDAGGVNVLYGTASGLGTARNQFWTQDSPGIGDAAESGDRFGAALAVGDFDGDGFDDLAVGAPNEDYGSLVDVGQFHVFYGSGGGLTATGDFYLPSVPGAQSGYRLGAALAAGDFNNDGYDDLAVGGPGRDLGNAVDAGLVAVLFGSASGLRSTGYQVWHQNVSGIADVSENGDQFGSALAVGYFNDDGYADLAIGVPTENLGSATDAGAVHVLHGASGGLTASGSQFWHQDVTDIIGVANSGDLFGSALAAGNFDGVGNDDLAIGAPGESVGSLAEAGAVNMIYSARFFGDGLVADANEIWHQDINDVLGVAEAGDRFGAALAAGYLGFGSTIDLAIGVPGEAVGNVANAGAVYVIAGLLASGLNPADDQLWYQDVAGVLGVSGTNDAFGSAIAIANFNGDASGFGSSDLAVGVPSEDFGSLSANAGGVNVLYSAGEDGPTASGDELWRQGGTGAGLLAGGEEGGAPDAPEAAAAGTAPVPPGTLALLPAAPNPFAGRTTLRFALPEAGAVRLAVYDALGREVALLVDEAREAGDYTVTFDAGALAAGVYLVRLEAGGQAQAQRLTRLR